MKKIRVLVVLGSLLVLGCATTGTYNVSNDTFTPIVCAPYNYPRLLVWPLFVKGEIINRKEFWEVSHSGWEKLVSLQHETERYIVDVRTMQKKLEDCIAAYNAQHAAQTKSESPETDEKSSGNWFTRWF